MILKVLLRNKYYVILGIAVFVCMILFLFDYNMNQREIYKENIAHALKINYKNIQENKSWRKKYAKPKICCLVPTLWKKKKDIHPVNLNIHYC